VQERYTEQLKKKHGPDIDPRSVPLMRMLCMLRAEVYRMGGGVCQEVLIAFS
jgi:hypothetical protein